MDHQNYVEAVLSGIGTDPDRVAVHQPDGSTITAAGLTDLIHRYAHALRDRGIRRGSTVSIMSGNRAEVLAARYATNLLGARVVSLYEGMAVDTLAVIAADVETDVLITDAAHAAGGARIAERAPIKHVLTFADLTGPTTPIAPEPVAANDIFCIRHTGGTTGHPKGIMLPYGPYTERLVDPKRPRLPGVMLVCSTLAHLAGMMADGVLTAGGSMVIHAGYDPARALDAIEKHRVNIVWLLPALLYQLTDEQRRRPRDTSSLRAVIYGGASSSPVKVAEAVETFGPVFTQFYAQTEAGAVSALGPQEHTRPELLGTVGKVLPGVEIRIVDADGRDVPPGGSGEIVKRSSGDSRGYLNNPELTAQVWRDGWVHTGDVGFLDADGYLHVTDRLKDMIIVVGGHVYPAEVESVLLTHPSIAAAAVFGVRDSDGTEHVHAALVPRSELDLETVRAHVTEHMGRQYAPSAITVVDAIPLTDAGKPDKKLLRSRVG
ncbi:AMP-binding protein [Kutzneria kofuensis]|uniref:Fatty-acyl-CoA synthase n=1 Tax=Kutzneria kofuensis TaxID=103725 RepID=A0A7W9NK35_9PSEU|nr:AMP-binding protein [Kutzneria kofuensis]MBB5895299.1 fatty-acyl-CoA synthase [Kutzneria kofuensis]